MDREAWRATVYGVPQSRTRLQRLSMHTCSLSGLFRHREPFTAVSEDPTLRSLVEPGQADAPQW